MRQVDPRPSIYGNLHKGQLSAQEQQNRHSASVILNLLRGHRQPKSVLDVGCGLGTWLDVAREAFNLVDVEGVEGSWLDESLLQVSREVVHVLDLEKEFDLKRRFGLVICLEVAEHLSPAAATGFVDSLARHADTILFSAAIPGQGGDHHVNEQFLTYWDALFEPHGFLSYDLIRPTIWHDESILWWLRQNVVVYSKDPLPAPRALSIVHPNVYLDRLRMLQSVIAQIQSAAQVQASGTMTLPPRRS